MRQQRQRRVRTFLNPLNGPLQNQPKISLMISLEIVPFGLEMCVSWRKCLRLGEWQSWNAELWSSFEMSAWIFQQNTLLAEIPTDLHRTRNWWNKRFSYHVISTSQKVFVAPQQMKSRPKKDQRTILFVSWANHCENAMWNFQIFTSTRSYAALRTADLDWIVRPGYSWGGYILGCSQRLTLCLRHSAQIGPDLTL